MICALIRQFVGSLIALIAPVPPHVFLNHNSSSIRHFAPPYPFDIDFRGDDQVVQHFQHISALRLHSSGQGPIVLLPCRDPPRHALDHELAIGDDEQLANPMPGRRLHRPDGCLNRGSTQSTTLIIYGDFGAIIGLFPDILLGDIPRTSCQDKQHKYHPYSMQSSPQYTPKPAMEPLLLFLQDPSVYTQTLSLSFGSNKSINYQRQIFPYRKRDRFSSFDNLK